MSKRVLTPEGWVIDEEPKQDAPAEAVEPLSPQEEKRAQNRLVYKKLNKDNAELASLLEASVNAGESADREIYQLKVALYFYTTRFDFPEGSDEATHVAESITPLIEGFEPV